LCRIAGWSSAHDPDPGLRLERLVALCSPQPHLQERVCARID
jgi:hypothetical protein